MENLRLISCVTLLTQNKTFSIDGTLYRYSHKSDGQHTQYYFIPLAQQRKTATLKLNKNKVMLLCYEVPSLYNQHHATVQNEVIQQSLF
jgi:hypothetical protein